MLDDSSRIGRQGDDTFELLSLRCFLLIVVLLIIVQIAFLGLIFILIFILIAIDRTGT